MTPAGCARGPAAGRQGGRRPWLARIGECGGRRGRRPVSQGGNNRAEQLGRQLAQWLDTSSNSSPECSAHAGALRRSAPLRQHSGGTANYPWTHYLTSASLQFVTQVRQNWGPPHSRWRVWGVQGMLGRDAGVIFSLLPSSRPPQGCTESRPVAAAVPCLTKGCPRPAGRAGAGGRAD